MMIHNIKKRITDSLKKTYPRNEENETSCKSSGNTQSVVSNLPPDRRKNNAKK